MARRVGDGRVTDRSGFDVDQYRRERLRRLERENEFYARDRDRLVRLLAAALAVAVGGTGCTIPALLTLLEDLDDNGVPVTALRDLLDPEPPLDPEPALGAA